ncbi:SseB family protein [Rathayibacter soli]|uniref:SseB family protein n=1 Tax=Rathayibacter soli TaxID=3144168 RepID=UPI0027E47AD9|nr:SseB family protein [Glaciibacter superstes]
MKPSARFPHSYVNTGVEFAIQGVYASQSEDALPALLHAALSGGLVVDITGSTQESGPRARTLVSSDGHGVLPLFTSMKALEEAVGTSAPGTMVQATILPAREALALVQTPDIAAVQFNPGPFGLVVARAHIEMALGVHSAEDT